MQQEGETMARVSLTGSCVSRSLLRLGGHFMLTQHNDVTTTTGSSSVLLRIKTEKLYRQYFWNIVDIDDLTGENIGTIRTLIIILQFSLFRFVVLNI